MKNLKLRNKIFLILVLPMIAIFMFTSILVVEKVENVSDMNKTSRYINFTVEVLKFLTNLQKEREISISYINSYGTNKESLENQIINTTVAQKNLENFINSFELIKQDNHLLEKVESLNANLDLITKTREDTIELKLDAKSLESYYSQTIFQLITFFDELLIYSNSKELLKASQTYISIINIIEKLYQEKNLVNDIFNYNQILNKDYNIFISLLISQDTEIGEMIKNLTKEQLEYFYSKIDNKYFKNIEELRSVIFLKVKKEELINIMKEHFGYGGMIHFYKDFVLSNDENILNDIQRNHTRILKEIREYKKLEHSEDENKFLTDIQNAIDSYMSKAFNNEHLEDTKELDKKTLKAFETLSKNIYGADIKKWQNNSFEKIAVFEDIQEKIVKDTLNFIDKNVRELDIQILLFVLSLVFLILIIFLVIMVMTSNVTKSIKKFENNLNQFFSYSMKEKDEIKLNKLEGKDEFALMTKNMNEQVLKIEEITKNDRQVILEITDVMEKVNKGFFEYSINSKSSTKELQTLVDIINKMLESTRSKLDSVNLLLNQYSKGNYQFKLDEPHTQKMQGDFGILYKSTTFLGETISSLIAMIENAGKHLEENTKILANSSNELAISSSNQASSLQQTSISLEQITQNLKNNNENMNKMQDISDELNSAANIGNKAAAQTFISMDEISKKVKAINEAITVIDQIAFQTNILSLNAAVEAATAGESGKGFAVVATEVRNLATKSANAAKEIKDLVESANLEANDGKTIADDMITGYENLASRISQTKDIIQNVTIFSKEQEVAISQINETVSSLDSATQKNAKTASNIDLLSNEVSNLSDKLLQITSTSKIDSKYYKMVQKRS